METSDVSETPSGKGLTPTMRWAVGLGCVALLAGVIAVLVFTGSDDDDERKRGMFGAYACDGPAQIYRGRPGFVRRPCVVSSDRIYAAIPEYQEIQRMRISQDNPRWHLLMRKASQRFNEAVNKMARAHNHDVVAEIGVCRANKEGVPEPPDRTDEVLALLQD